MVALCIASPEGQVGKTAMCIGIARKLQSDGKKAGYFKPISVRTDGGSFKSAYTDCVFANEAMELARNQETLCPVVIDQKDLNAAASRSGDFVKKIEDAYRVVSLDKDVMVVEGPAGLKKADPGTAFLAAILSAIPARLIVVLQYTEKGLMADFEGIETGLKAKISGLIVNAVPSNRMAQKAQLCSGIGVPVLGFVPQDRTLMGISVRDITEAISGEELSPGDGATELVENVMAGAAVLDSGPSYFNRKSNKAVLVRGERADMQLAALETPTKVMVLTGGVKPIDQVSKQARRRKVPIVVTQEDTVTALSLVSDAVQKATFAHRQKLSKLDEILAQNFDFKGLYKSVGL